MEGDQGGRDTGRILSAVFLCLLGISMLVVGGSCTFLWVAMGGSGMGAIGVLLALACFVVFIGGFYVLHQAIKAFREPPPER